MRNPRLPVLLLACMLFVSGGCPKEPTTPTILQPRAQPFVADVPVPKGFDQDIRKSVHNSVPGKRSITHYYDGTEKLRLVRDFYVEKMPEFEWQLVNEKLEAGVYVLNYRKNDETCEIRIESLPGGFLAGNQTQIRATIKPMYAESPG